MSRTKLRGPIGFLVIGVYKLAKAALLILAGVVLLRTPKSEVAAALVRLAAALRLDPENRFLHGALARLSGLDERRFEQIGIGTILYGMLYVVQSIGLLLQRRWGAYLVVVTTGLLIPVEVYEVVRKVTAPRIGVLVLNLVIVAYLVASLKDRSGEAETRPSETRVE